MSDLRIIITSLDLNYFDCNDDFDENGIVYHINNVNGDKKKFYHGINKILYFDKTITKFNAH